MKKFNLKTASLLLGIVIAFVSQAHAQSNNFYWTYNGSGDAGNPANYTYYGTTKPGCNAGGEHVCAIYEPSTTGTSSGQPIIDAYSYQFLEQMVPGYNYVNRYNVFLRI